MVHVTMTSQACISVIASLTHLFPIFRHRLLRLFVCLEVDVSLATRATVALYVNEDVHRLQWAEELKAQEIHEFSQFNER